MAEVDSKGCRWRVTWSEEREKGVICITTIGYSKITQKLKLGGKCKKGIIVFEESYF